MRAWTGSKKCAGVSWRLQFLDHAVVDQHRAEERGLGLDVGGQARRGALRIGGADASEAPGAGAKAAVGMPCSDARAHGGAQADAAAILFHSLWIGLHRALPARAASA